MTTISNVLKEYVKNSISKLTDKTQLCELLKIVIENNPNINLNKQTNKIYVDLNNITDNTYILLNDYLQSCNNKTTQKITYTPYNNDNARLKGFTAEEKSIIEHAKYIEDIQNNQK